MRNPTTPPTTNHHQPEPPPHFSPAKKERVIEAISQNMIDDEDEFARDEEFWEAPY